MGFFDKQYDQMNLQEVCYRLPSELAVGSLKRRITDLMTLLDFVKTVGGQPTFVPELKEHINNLISNETVPNVLAVFDKEQHKSLFGWLNETNKNRLKNEGRASLDRKFLFNLAGNKDLEDLKAVLTNILEEPEVKIMAVSSVLNKADPEIFGQLMDIVIRDKRPEVRQCVLALNSKNANLVSDNQLLVGLKAFVVSFTKLPQINKLDFKLFSNLKPLERLGALGKYFTYFRPYHKISVFSTNPSQEEFDTILFAGCLEHNDLVVELNEKFKQLTQMDEPVKDTDDEDEI